MTLREMYEALGGDFDKALSGLMKESFVERFSLMYLRDDSMNTLEQSVAAGDIATSFRAAHTLKGVSANLAFTQLQQAAIELTEQLRPQNAPADEKLLAAVRETHQKAIGALTAYKEANGL